MAEKFSLKDHLFNETTLTQLGQEYAAGVAGFDADRFLDQVLPGLASRELLARLDWIADCISDQLAPDFPDMAAQIRAAMPDRLDPSLRDDDFGQFIHAVPGILAVRHGLDQHRDLALDLIYEATQRFSMEFYIRAFLNHWPDETMARLRGWALDDNYHVRRLVSEGTRPRLPWASNIDLDIEHPLPLLDLLHSDPTRYVTRSVANHLNDITKKRPDLVLDHLRNWRDQGKQHQKELDWMTRHALRNLIKQGHSGAMQMLGYRQDADVSLHNLTMAPSVKRGEALLFSFDLSAPTREPVLVDYILQAVKSDGTRAPKVYKLKTATLVPDTPLAFKKSHKFKDNATTFRLHPGAHRIDIQVNGRVIGGQEFDLL